MPSIWPRGRTFAWSRGPSALPWARHLAMRVKGPAGAARRLRPERGTAQQRGRLLLSTLAAHASTAIEAARLLREVRRQAAEVGRLQSRQESILESSGVGLLLTDGDGEILAWNRALEMIYGLPP